MATTTNISWTNVTWNIARGCSKVDADCKYCYMFRDSMAGKRYVPNAVLRTKTVFNLPLTIKTPSRIFTSSLTDFFHPDIDDYRWEAFDIIRRCPQHTFQILTKRPERIIACIKIAWMQTAIMANYYNNEELNKTRWWLQEWLYGTRQFEPPIKGATFGCPKEIEPLPPAPPKNVWLGTSCGTQQSIDVRVRELLKVPAAVRFLSAEPLIGPIDLLNLTGNVGSRYQVLKPITNCGDSNRPALDWVIVAGESGNDTGKYLYRSCQLSWIEKIVDQCKQNNVPVFVKQLGTHLAKQLKLKSRHGSDMAEWPEHLQIQQFPEV